MTMLSKRFPSVFAVVFFLMMTLSGFAQSDYEKGWQALTNKDVPKAIELLEKAAKKSDQREAALLTLSMLYPKVSQEKKGKEVFYEYYKTAADPYPAMFPLLLSDSGIGSTGKKPKASIKLLEELYKDEKAKGKFDAAVLYYLGLHETFSYDKDKAMPYYDAIGEIEDWGLVGPFDNVMNSGFDKDFGALAKPKSDASFTSKYGAPVTWFDPPIHNTDGYFFKMTNFISSNSLIYAQSFVASDKAQEVILKFGYSGSLKVWLNDELVYGQPDQRTTEIDYFNYKVILNKGANRILLQLGDYRTNNANFTLRFTDLNHNLLRLPYQATYQDYQKNNGTITEIPFFGLTSLKNQAAATPNDLLTKLLLTKTYLRTNQIDDAEKIIKEAEALAPHNYLVLRSLITLYNDANNDTEQKRYYSIFKEKYPKDMKVLLSEIEKNNSKDKRKKLTELVTETKALYPDPYRSHAFTIMDHLLDEDYNKIIDVIGKMYDEYPTRSEAVQAKYQLEKNMGSKSSVYNKILENYLEDTYDYSMIKELANNYSDEGDIDKAIKLIEKSKAIANYDFTFHKKIKTMLTRQQKYKDAIKQAETIIENRPSDYTTLNDLALLHNFEGDKKEALRYHELSLKYFPFTFETNEKVRELTGKKKTMDMVRKYEPQEVIKKYEADFKPTIKRSYDIVLDDKTMIIYKSKAKAMNRNYMLRINDENAIETWQNINLSPDNNMRTTVNEVKTIKANGDEIDAERSGAEAVFTNLEVGDFIFVSYTEKQVRGGKSDLFVYDNFGLNAYYPVFDRKYTVLVEDGLTMKEQLINTTEKPQVSNDDGFKSYTWLMTSPKIIKEENNAPPFSDVSENVHVALDQTWYDIAQWYSDLSGTQARPDYTIQQIVKDLFGDKKYSEEEKAKMIYEFVCKNIQYSYIDFRQSGHIPQKASKVYHSRLGDCKDVSTLYASIARSVGLDANLVLINTRDNGQKSTVMPSLNFNHCIVKVKVDDQPLFLELTDQDLPYGHLYYYHDGATILEIPNENISKDIKLEYLEKNQGYPNKIIRKTTIKVTPEEKLQVNMDVTKTGTKAANACRSYFYEDKSKHLEILEKSVSSFFDSNTKVTDVDFKTLEPRKEKAEYLYNYTVDKEVLKVGSFRSLKIPFADVLAYNTAFKDTERENDFNFIFYETTDSYDETMDINLEGSFKFVEIPENIQYEYQGTKYDLKFEKISDQQLRIHRIYSVNPQIVKAKDFPAFQEFMLKVIEAENTNVVFK